MTDSITWLHFSDLHFSSTESDDQNGSYERLLNGIDCKLKLGYQKPHFIFITGDLTDRGAKEGIDKFVLFLQKLHKIIPYTCDGVDIAKRTFLVPGNHDLDRKWTKEKNGEIPGNDVLFPLTSEAQASRESFLLNRFPVFSHEELRPYLAWMDTEAGTYSEVVSLTAEDVNVGVGLINTSWLCESSRKDKGKLTPGVDLVKHMLHKIDACEIKIVLGHHPLFWLKQDHHEKIKTLLHDNKVIYLHGHEHETKSDKNQWPIMIQCGATWQGAGSARTNNQFIWAGINLRPEIPELSFKVYADILLSVNGWAVDNGARIPGAVVHSDIDGNQHTIFLVDDPTQRSKVFRSPKSEPFTTRYTRLSRNGKIVDEHEYRSSDDDLGDFAFTREPVSVDDALSTNAKVYLVGARGTGKSYSLRKMYSKLKLSILQNDTGTLWMQYKNWDHPPKLLPIWLDAPQFADWLVVRNTLDDGASSILQYCEEQNERKPGRLSFVPLKDKQQKFAYPFNNAKEMRIHIRRNGFALFIDGWSYLEKNQIEKITDAINSLMALDSERRKLVVYSATRESSGRHQPNHSRTTINGKLTEGSPAQKGAVNKQGLVKLDIDKSFERFTVAQYNFEQINQIVEEYANDDGKSEVETQYIKEFVKVNHYLAGTVQGIRCLLYSQRLGEGIDRLNTYLNGNELIDELVTLLKNDNFIKEIKLLLQDEYVCSEVDRLKSSIKNEKLHEEVQKFIRGHKFKEQIKRLLQGKHLVKITRWLLEREALAGIAARLSPCDYYKEHLRLAFPSGEMGQDGVPIALHCLYEPIKNAFMDNPDHRLLRLNLAACPGVELLEKEGFIWKRLQDGHYHISNARHQDVLIGKVLTEGSLSDVITSKYLLKHEDHSPLHIPRREPVLLAFFWHIGTDIKGDEASQRVSAMLKAMFECLGDTAPQDLSQCSYNTREMIKSLTICIAEIIIELSYHWEKDLIKKLGRHYCDQYAEYSRIIIEAKKYEHLPLPYDRHLLGQARALIQRLREGAGLRVSHESPVSGPFIKWIKISAGTQTLGCDNQVLDKMFDGVSLTPDDEERVKHTEHKWFKLSKYLITNQQYKAFVDDRILGYHSDWVWSEIDGITLKKPEKKRFNAKSLLQETPFDELPIKIGDAEANQPVSRLTWDECKAFCRWCSRLFGYKVDLPNAKRWEYAARVGRKPNEQFTYDGEYAEKKANTQEEGLPGVVAVGLFPESKSEDGVMDMIGQVFEWCDNPYVESEPYFMETRGGSYNHDRLRSRISTRGKKRRDSAHPYMGFRICTESSTQGKTRPRIVIVGGGFAGTCTAIRLLQLANDPVEIVLIEKSAEQRLGGLAYSKASAHWEHLFNLQAGRISAFREDRDDFVKWLNSDATKERWKSSWDKNWRDVVFHRSSAVPRCLYQQYLEDRLREAASAAHPDTSFVMLSGEVKDVDMVKKTVNVKRTTEDIFHDGWDKNNHLKIKCDHVIIASGNITTRNPGFDPVESLGSLYFKDQYSVDARKAMASLPSDGNVLVFGSALRAYDVVMTLKSEYSALRKDGVNITFLSRNNKSHPIYDENHQHEVLKLDAPPKFISKTYASIKPEQLRSMIVKEYEEISKHEALCEMEQGLKSERILKAWEPYVPEFIRRTSKEALKKLYYEFRSVVTISRIGVVREIGDVVNGAKQEQDGKGVLKTLKYVPTSFKAEKIKADDRHVARCTWEDPQNKNDARVEDHYHLVINCVGREQDYLSDSLYNDSHLWQSLIESGIAQPQHLTDIGIEVDEEGALATSITEDNFRSNPWITCVGVMREGDELSRYGRLGSFSFTLGPIKNQALQAAVYVLRKLHGVKEGEVVKVFRKDIDGLCKKQFANEQLWSSNAMSYCLKDAVKQITKEELNEERVVEVVKNFMEEVEKQKRSYAEFMLFDVKKTEQRKVVQKMISKLCSPSDRERVLHAFTWRIQELALAHLTRLDEVEPREYFSKNSGLAVSLYSNQLEENQSEEV